MSTRYLVFRTRLLISGENQKKLLILNALIEVLRDFQKAKWIPSNEPIVRAFLIFLARFIDCMASIHELSRKGFSRQANIVNRHALECAVYLGAIASEPTLLDAITCQEIYQRKKLRVACVQIGIMSASEKQRMDQLSINQLQPFQQDLTTLSQLITAEKTNRGWQNPTTQHELSVNDLALCSEVFDIFPKLYKNLNRSVHVFFGGLIDDHVFQVGGVERIRSATATMSMWPVAEATALISAVFEQTDKLFGTILFESTSEAFMKYWPSND